MIILLLCCDVSYGSEWRVNVGMGEGVVAKEEKQILEETLNTYIIYLVSPFIGVCEFIRYLFYILFETPILILFFCMAAYFCCTDWCLSSILK